MKQDENPLEEKKTSKYWRGIKIATLLIATHIIVAGSVFLYTRYSTALKYKPLIVENAELVEQIIQKSVGILSKSVENTELLEQIKQEIEPKYIEQVKQIMQKSESLHSEYETNLQLQDTVVKELKEIVEVDDEVIKSLETYIKKKDEYIALLNEENKKNDEYIGKLEEYVEKLKEACPLMSGEYAKLLEHVIPLYADKSKDGRLSVKEINELLKDVKCKEIPLPNNYQGELIPAVFVAEDINECSCKIEKLGSFDSEGKSKKQQATKNAIISIKIPLKDADAYVKAHRRM